MLLEVVGTAESASRLLLALRKTTRNLRVGQLTKNVVLSSSSTSLHLDAD